MENQISLTALRQKQFPINKAIWSALAALIALGVVVTGLIESGKNPSPSGQMRDSSLESLSLSNSNISQPTNASNKGLVSSLEEIDIGKLDKVNLAKAFSHIKIATNLSLRAQIRTKMSRGQSGDKSAEAIINSIMSEYSGQFVAEDQLLFIYGNIASLGAISQQSSVALDFLLGHVTPESWRRLRTWKMSHSSVLEEWEDTNLAQRCLMGLGDGGNEYVLEFMKQLESRDSTFQKNWAGAAVTAVFNYDMNKMRGLGWQYRSHDDHIHDGTTQCGEHAMRAFHQWKLSERGAEFTRISRRMKGIE